MTERYGRLLVSGLMAALCFLSPLANAELSPEQMSPEQIYRKVLPSVMTLEVENVAGERYIASGLIAFSDDIAVTAWHVVSDAHSVWASFADGARVRVVGCIDKDGERDLALIKLERAMPGRRAALSSELEPVASRAFVIGAPKGYGFSITDGLVSQIRRVDGFPQYQVSCPISSGNSGGPVLNGQGQVIGIASWTKSDAQNVSFAIPVAELSRLNASAASVSWENLTPARRPPIAARTIAAAPVTSPQQGTAAAGTLIDLKKRLQNSVGKTVTVVLREETGTGNDEEKFTFTVPSSGLK